MKSARKGSELLDRMAANPAADRTMEDVRRVWDHHGLRFTAPTGGGSHFKLSHRSRRDILTIPFRRPVKSIYIRKLVQFVRGLEAENAP